MKKFRFPLFVAAVALVLSVLAGSALAAKPKPVTFTGSYTGNATTKVDGTTATIAANGTGTGTVVGAGKVTGNGTGDTSQQPCIPFGGTGSITGAGGSINFKVNSDASGCGDEGGHTFAITGHATVLSTTGKLAKLKGTLRMTGTFNHDDGSFSVKFTGTLKA